MHRYVCHVITLTYFPQAVVDSVRVKRLHLSAYVLAAIIVYHGMYRPQMIQPTGLRSTATNDLGLARK